MNTNIVALILAGLAVVIGVVFFLTTSINNTMMDNRNHEDGVVEEYEISPGDVAGKIKNNERFVLLDVRTPEEYEKFHLKDALLLPVQELSAQSLADIGLGADAKDTEIIVYCRSGTRGKTAYDIMQSLGYTNVKNIAGGMIHWQEDNYPFGETGVYVGPTTGMMMEGSTVQTTDGPRIALDRASHDFGVVPQYGGVVETTFTITNKGTKTLSIGTITTSCSCTSARISQTDVAAGGEATLTVSFDPDFNAEPTGVFKRTVFIPTNDSTNSEVEVVLQVDIAEGV